jgi:multiple sugar transport system permease protein
MRTIQLGLQVFNGQYQIQYNLLMAATVVVSLPLALMFFVFQKQFIKSLISSSVKG